MCVYIYYIYIWYKERDTLIAYGDNRVMQLGIIVQLFLGSLGIIVGTYEHTLFDGMGPGTNTCEGLNCGFTFPAAFKF